MINLSPGIILTFGFLTLSILSLWLAADAGFRSKLNFRNVFLALALLCGLWFGFVNLTAFIPILGLAAACYMDVKYRESKAGVITGLFVILFSVGLALHIFPSFSNPRVIDKIMFSRQAMPYSNYFNFDKILIGLFILARHKVLSTKKEWADAFRLSAPITLFTVFIVCTISLIMGYVRFDFKIPLVIPLWAWSNLFFTCVPEEAFFRGFLQRRLNAMLDKTKNGSVLALFTAALLFGAAHYAGGGRYIVLAAIAGIGYGWVYKRTGSIETSILTHFSLNIVHFIFFTYPAFNF